jgi:hypothetical protein
MASSSLAELNEAAMTAREPAFTSDLTVRPGGVDPLGLRQINFDLMDLVLPGLNNIARHIRPFTVVTWAWRRAAICARDQGKARVDVADLEDFVDRIEVVYVWSQLMRPEGADLPGRDVLARLIADGKYTFGGEDWRIRRERRSDSTALSAPINYGPGLKALGWLRPDAEGKGALVPAPVVYEAINAFEEEISSYLGHPAFAKFGAVTVTNADLEKLGDAWALERPTVAEQRAMVTTLAGEEANKHRRGGIKLAVAAAQHLNGPPDLLAVRRTMCGSPSDFVPAPELKTAAEAWRAVQVRQLFRLALEALLHWMLRRLDAGPMTTASLAGAFLKGAGDAPTTGQWLTPAGAGGTGPADWVDRLEKSLSPLDDEDDLLATVRTALAMSLAEAPEQAGSERDDRLPLARAAKEARDYIDRAPRAFIEHIVESWVFGQHVYWSVGRGLADARGRGKTILRLKATFEDTGWNLAPGAKVADRNAPRATGDRLETAITLLREAGLIA